MPVMPCHKVEDGIEAAKLSSVIIKCDILYLGFVIARVAGSHEKMEINSRRCFHLKRGN